MRGVNGPTPLVSIAVPVRDGARFLDEALASLVSQTLDDLEIIVSDNASTDDTPRIARAWAARDERVRYVRNERDLGAAPNFNQALALARGRYFRWAAADDLAAPEHLARCVAVLERRPAVVLCHSRVRVVDASSRRVAEPAYLLRTDDPDPVRRFAELLFVRNQCFEVFGVMRTDELRRTRGVGAYPVGDRVLLSELAFRGPFHEVPEALFLSREHPDRSVRRLPSQRERAAWFDTALRGRITLPEWRTCGEYCRAIARAPLGPVDRLRAALCMVRWAYRYKRRMADDVWAAMQALARRAAADRQFDISKEVVR